jgi:hypothetical protein
MLQRKAPPTQETPARMWRNRRTQTMVDDLEERWTEEA